MATAGIAATDSTVESADSHLEAQEDDQVAEATCAANPPEDLADPDGDPLGWENGYWYTESINVSQADGVQADERKTIVSRTMARVEAVRCIEFNRTVPVSLMSREEFRKQQLQRNATEGLRLFDNAKFEALFLINESADSLTVQRQNAAGGVLGFYDPRTDEIVVIAQSPEELRIDELTLAHELVHAWQDQRFNISRDPFDAMLRDQANAIDGIIEGDASYTETLYQRRCGQQWDCLEAQQVGDFQLANIGVYLVKLQPYTDGPAFVRMVRAVGGWDAVNGLYEQLPQSTEQIIHPQKYDVDAPTNVTIDDTATENWSRVRPPDRPGYGRVGEAAVMMMFVYPFYDSRGRTNIVEPAEWFNYNETGNISDFDPLSYESNYSVGWDGDRLHVYENDAGKLGYVWKLAWDSPQDARQFVTGYLRVLRYWGAEQVGPNTWRIAEGGFADAFYVEVNATTVTIVNAPTVEQLSEVRPGIDVAVTGNVTETDETTANETTTTNETATNETA